MKRALAIAFAVGAVGGATATRACRLNSPAFHAVHLQARRLPCSHPYCTGASAVVCARQKVFAPTHDVRRRRLASSAQPIEYYVGVVAKRLAGMALESAVRDQSGVQPARVLFVTGAGMSAESGLPTYRGVSGLYNQVSEHALPMPPVLRLPHALTCASLAPPLQPGSHGRRRRHRGCH